CAAYLAKRLLVHFVTARFTSTDLSDVASMIQSNQFDVRAVMKTLLKSRWFFDPSNRFALVEGPVSWSIRAARALGYDLAAADAPPGRACPSRRPAPARPPPRRARRRVAPGPVALGVQLGPGERGHAGANATARLSRPLFTRRAALLTETVMITTRRRFLQGVGATGVLAAVGCKPSAPGVQPVPPIAIPTKPILVVVDIDGGNDWLNMMPPLSGTNRSVYESKRPSLAVPPQQTTALDNGAGLNADFAGMAELDALGRIAWIPGIGMNNPNLSHFVS